MAKGKRILLTKQQKEKEDAENKKHAGRPLGLTPERAARMVELARGGNFPETCFAIVGVPRPTGLGWLTAGARTAEALEKGKELSDTDRVLAQFSTDFTAAHASAVGGMVMGIHRAGVGAPADKAKGTAAIKPDWHALAFLLPRLDPAWSEKHRHELSGPNGGPIQTSISGQFAEMYARAQEAVKQKA